MCKETYIFQSSYVMFTATKLQDHCSTKSNPYSIVMPFKTFCNLIPNYLSNFSLWSYLGVSF